MIGGATQNVFNINLSKLNEQYSKVQVSYQDTTCDDNFFFKGSTKRATGFIKCILAMPSYSEYSVDEMRVNVYANTSPEILDFVYKGVNNGFSDISSNIQQNNGMNLLNQNKNQTLFGGSTLTSTNQSNNVLGTLGSQTNNNPIIGSNTGSSLFSGLGATGNTLQTNNMSSNMLGGSFGNNTSLNTNLSGFNQNVNPLLGSTTNAFNTNTNLLQSGTGSFQNTSTLTQQPSSIFQNTGSLFNTNTTNLGQNTTNLNQLSPFKSTVSSTTNTLGQQNNTMPSTLGGLNSGSIVGLPNTGTTLSSGTDIFKSGGTSNILGTTTNNLFSQNTLGGTTTGLSTNLSGGNAKSLFSNTNQSLQNSGSNTLGLGNSVVGLGSNNLLGGNTASNTLQPSNTLSNNNSLGSGLLQNTSTGLFNSSSNTLGATNTTLSGGGGLSGGLLGTSNTLGLSSNTTGLTGVGGIGLTSNTSSLQPSTTLGNNNTLFNLNNSNPLSLNTATSLNSNSLLNKGGQPSASTVGTLTKSGPRTLTLSTQNNNAANSLVVNEDELLEFRRQRQINKYVDSMRNLRKSSNRSTQLSDTSIIQSTSKTADNLLSNSIVERSKPLKSTVTGLPTSFNQISKMYTNKGYNALYNINSSRNGHDTSRNGSMINNATSSPYGDSIKRSYNYFSNESTTITIGDESAKLVRNALLASKRNSLLNRSDVLPLVSIKTELDCDLRDQHSRSVTKFGKYSSPTNCDFESTRCEHCRHSTSTLPSSSLNSSKCTHCVSHIKESSAIPAVTQPIHTTRKDEVVSPKHTEKNSKNDCNNGKSLSASPLSSSNSTSCSSISNTSSTSTSSIFLKHTTQSNRISFDDECATCLKDASGDVDPSSYGTTDGVHSCYTPTKCNITLKRPGYYTKPSLKELDELCTDGKCLVKGFVVGRKHYGFATFPDEVDVYGLNLDEIVIFNRALVEIYPDDYPNKPPQGQGLNRRAIITLYKVYPHGLSENSGVIRNADLLPPNSCIELMENLTLSLGALFVDYIPSDGTWTFEVPHFTKYGLDLSHEHFASIDSNNNLNEKTGMINLSSHLIPCKSDNEDMKFTQKSFYECINSHHLISDEIQPNTLTSPVLNNEPLNPPCMKRSHCSFLQNVSESSSISVIEHNPLFKFDDNNANQNHTVPFNSHPEKDTDQVYFPPKVVKDQPNYVSDVYNNYHCVDIFPKSILPEVLNHYTFQPIMYASTKSYHCKSITIDDNKPLVECFIRQQSVYNPSLTNKCTLQVRSTNHGEPKIFWDMSRLFSYTGHIGCNGYTTAYVQSRHAINYCSLKNNAAFHYMTMSPQVVHVFKSHYDVVDQTYMDSGILEKIFNLLLRYSTQNINNGFVSRSISSSKSLIAFIDELVAYVSHSTTRNCYLGPLFQLLKILFLNDDLLAENGIVHKNFINSKSNSLTPVEYYRKNELLDWVKKMTQSTLDNAVHAYTTEHNSDPYRAVMIANYYLASQRCHQAADILFDNNFDQLSLISTMTHADNISKYRIYCQIEKWRSMGVLDDVGDDVLTLLAIVCGMNYYPIVQSSSNAVNKNSNCHDKNDITVSDYTPYPYWVNFDWISSFGLFLFNYSKPNLSIAEVFKCFSMAVKKVSKNYSHCKVFNELGNDSLSRFFSKLTRSLFYLYCGNNRPLNELVDEFVVLNDSYSSTIPVIWLVIILLNHLSPNIVSKLVCVTVTMRFSELLELNGLWHYSIYVLTFIQPIVSQYNSLVQNIIMRNYDHLHQYIGFLSHYQLVLSENDTIKKCMLSYIKSYPYENLQLLQSIVVMYKDSLKNEAINNSFDARKYLPIIEMVFGRLNQFKTQSHSEHCVIEDLRFKCTDMMVTISHKLATSDEIY